MKTEDSWLQRELKPLTWPLGLMGERLAEVKDKEALIGKRAARKKYPSRAIRYWWAHCALLDEMKGRGGFQVTDLGSSSGKFLQYAGRIPGAVFTAADWNIDAESLKEAGYDRLVEADLARPLPLEDASADAVIFLHVLEHLPDPEPAVKEISRILKPGGLLLAGTPVAPSPISSILDKGMQRRYREGKIAKGGHIHSFSTGDWRGFLKAAGLKPELFFGAFFMRWSNNPLEDCRFWIKANLLWGVLFPGLGGELYLTARKPLEG
jgi:SAM-dependent methyltransferase